MCNDRAIVKKIKSEKNPILIHNFYNLHNTKITKLVSNREKNDLS